LKDRHITRNELKAYINLDKYPGHCVKQEFLDIYCIIELYLWFT